MNKIEIRKTSTGIRTGRTRGFTLVELVFTLAIVAVLASISMISMAGFRQRADAVGCMQHMKSIGIALNAYTMDYGYWPQLPIETMDPDEEALYGFWIPVLEPYNIHADLWLCPTHRRQLRGESSLAQDDEPEFIGTYLPTPFEKNNSAPFVHGTPWVLEGGDFHMSGCHVLMPDGSIQRWRGQLK
jgi:prepilin-type N-terminal cleavage/methylation domain-containing protein